MIFYALGEGERGKLTYLRTTGKFVHPFLPQDFNYFPRFSENKQKLALRVHKHLGEKLNKHKYPCKRFSMN